MPQDTLPTHSLTLHPFALRSLTQGSLTQGLLAPLPTETPAPILLAYPRIYQNMPTLEWAEAFAQVLSKCVELAMHRPAPENRHGGFFGLGNDSNHRLVLYTVWGTDNSQSDIFIIAGQGDGFGPGHTCPKAEVLLTGDYGCLVPLPLLV